MKSPCFSSAVCRLRRFSGEVKVVDPELTTDRTALWKPPDMQYDEFTVGTGGEFAIDRFPESCIFQFIAFVIDRLAIHVLNREMRSSGAFHFFVFVISREVVGGVGLHGNELIDSRVGDAGPIESNRQRLPSGVRVGGVEFQCDDATLLLIPPVKARI